MTYPTSSGSNMLSRGANNFEMSVIKYAITVVLLGFILSVVLPSRAQSSNMSPYSLILLQINGKPYCRGILIDRIALTAAHCIHENVSVGISYLKKGGMLTARPVKVETLGANQSVSPSRDVSILTFDKPVDADIDGSIELTLNTIAAQSGKFQNYYLADKWLFRASDISFELSARHDSNLYYRGSTKAELIFSLNPARSVAGYLGDINSEKPGKLSPDTISRSSEQQVVCRGHSGAPIFGEINGIHYLVAINVATDRSGSIIGNRLCSDLVIAEKLNFPIETLMPID